MDKHIVYLKDLRVQIDHALQNVKAYKAAASESNLPGGREMALSYTKLQEAKMWIGKALEETGHELPKEFQDKSE